MRRYLKRTQTLAFLAISLCLLARLHPLAAGDCPLSPERLPLRQGLPTGGDCTLQPGGLGSCHFACKALQTCKLFYVSSCTPDDQCTCAVCTQLLAVNFSVPSVHFRLQTKSIGSFNNAANLPGGLVVGRPVLFTIWPIDAVQIFYFRASNGDRAFHTEISFLQKHVISNSYIGGFWGDEDDVTYTTQFDFTYHRDIFVFCVVTSENYQLHLNGILYKIFPHRMPISRVEVFVLDNENSQLKSMSQ